jgi:hypothetical protein
MRKDPNVIRLVSDIQKGWSMAVGMLLAAALSANLPAQDTLAVNAGARVRLMTLQDSGWRYARLVRLVPDSLVIHSASSPEDQSFSRIALREVQIYVRDDSVQSKHVTNGVIVGGLIGVLASVAAEHHCETHSHSSEGPPCGIGLSMAPFVVLAGLFGGGIIGAEWPSARWVPLALR